MSVNASLTVPSVSEAISGRAEQVNHRTAVFASIFARIQLMIERVQRLFRQGRANCFQSDAQA